MEDEYTVPPEDDDIDECWNEVRKKVAFPSPAKRRVVIPCTLYKANQNTPSFLG